MTDAPDTPPNPWIKRARIAGQITAGLILGALLLPALLELASLISDISPFKYQGF